MLHVPDFARFISSNCESRIIDAYFSSKQTKVYKLYAAYANDYGLDEDNTAKKLGYKDKNSLAFRSLKSRLKHKLLNLSVLIDTQITEYSERQSAYFDHHKKWVAIRILLFKSARLEAMQLAEETLKGVDKFGFSDLKFFILRDLCNHYAQHLENKKVYNHYKQILDESFSHLQEEVINETKLNEVNLLSKEIGSGSIKVLNDKYSYTIEDEIESLSQCSTLRSFLMKYQFLHYLLLRLNKTEENLKVDRIAKECLLTQYPNSKIGHIMVLQNTALTQLKAGHYKQSLRLFREAEQARTTGSIGWYYIKIYEIISLFHMSLYESCIHEIYSSINRKEYEKLIPTYKQFFYILQAYIEFIASVKHFDTGKQDQFRIHKFLNDVPAYAKDKRGLNIAILIVHFLFLIQQRKYSKAIDRVEALNQYCFRYLRKDENFRSNCFIKMLIQVTKADFHPVRTSRYAEPYRKKLLTVPMQIADQPLDVEIVPYEELWDMVMEILEANLNK